MGLLLKILIYCYLCTGVQSVQQIQWLPCQFTDEHVSINHLGHTETQLIPREAMLQFGQKGDAPVNPQAITFLLTASKLDLRRYLDGVEPEELECVLRRYSTEGIYVRWPVQGAQGYNHWFTCTLKHSEGHFTVTSFLRLPSDGPPPEKQDYHKWPPIADRETITTSVAMVIKTHSPSLKTRLMSQQKLHCQFDIDHRGPDYTVEWHRRGERTTLFSHSARSGQTKGTGVVQKALAGGDASYTLPFVKMASEGTYICSVSVTPLSGSVDVNLQIEEPPRVSLNSLNSLRVAPLVGPTLSLQEGEEQKIVCEAENYYPLDVEIVVHEQDPAASGQRVGAPLPKALPNVLLSSHRHNQDQTYSVSAFFYIQASLQMSGRQFTCTVSHKSLRVPVRKSFILNVEERVSWMFYLTVGFIVLLLLVILAVMIPQLPLVGKKTVQKKPY